MLRHIRPVGAAGSALKWEGIVIDPIGALLAVLVAEAVPLGDPAGMGMLVLKRTTLTVVCGVGTGIVSALFMIEVMRRHWVPDYLENAVSLMLMVAAFTGADAMQHEAGLFAVTVMGFILANQKRVDVRHIVEFKENLQVLIISALFIVLGARLDIDQLKRVAGPGLLFVAVLILFVRPLSVMVSTLGSTLKVRERLFISWLAPRGIVAAAVASVLAIKLEKHGHTGDADLLVPYTFITIIATVAVYALTAPAVARLLKVADANPQGVLFLGAHSWAREIAQAIRKLGHEVVLVDTNRNNIKRARMAGMRAYSGSILAEQALDDINLGGIGRLFAVSSNDWVNVLAVDRFRPLFGRAKCYQLAQQKESANPDKDDPHEYLAGRTLFGEALHYTEMSRLLVEGYAVKATKLSEEFDYAAYRERYDEGLVPLMIQDFNGNLQVVATDTKVEPQPGETIISFVKEPATAD